MTKFGEAKFILGIDIVGNREAGTIILSYEQYTNEILEKYGTLDNTPSKMPMAPTHHRDVEVASDYDKVVLQLGTDSYTKVVPAPQGGRLW
jgi:hypothetical protein